MNLTLDLVIVKFHLFVYFHIFNNGICETENATYVTVFIDSTPAVGYSQNNSIIYFPVQILS